MQPKRDPNDRRYWPAEDGGTGCGFNNTPKPDRSSYFANAGPALTDPTSLHKRPEGRTPEAIRARSRAVYELALDRLEGLLTATNEDGSPSDLSPTELAQIANTTGRLGLGGDESPTGNVTVTIVRDSTPSTILTSIVTTPQRLLPPSPNTTPD